MSAGLEDLSDAMLAELIAETRENLADLEEERLFRVGDGLEHPIGPSQRRSLLVMHEEATKNQGVLPSIAEVARRRGFASPNAVHMHITQMLKHGWVVRIGDRARRIGRFYRVAALPRP